MTTEWISILDLIRNNSFEASLITTFNTYLPFYEEVVLRRLLSSGCRHNVLMMDASQFSECLQTPSLRPTSAGFDYSLIPIKATGAFHPKIILLVSKKKGLLFIGSHNITLSGLSINKELTTQINISNNKDEEVLQIAQDVWAYILNWIDSQMGVLPEKVFEAVHAVKRFSPWLNIKVQAQPGNMKFFGSTPDGRSLWDKVRQNISGIVKCVTCVGPFFDQKLEFLNIIQTDLSPQKLIVGIDPSSVTIPVLKDMGETIQFVDASSLAKESGYLHAKALYIETETNSWFLTGSANPSHPAWSASSIRRNAEAMVMLEGEIAINRAAALEISTLKDKPQITTEDWSKIEIRTLEQKQKTDDGSGPSAAIAIADKNTINFSVSDFDMDKFESADCYDDNQNIIYRSEKCSLSGNIIKLAVNKKVADIRYAIVFLSDATNLHFLIHHSTEIKRRFTNSGQIQFRKALDSLQNDNPDLENLISIVSKSIFESPVEINPKVIRKTVGINKKSDKTIKPKEIESLSINLADTKKNIKKTTRVVNSGDLSALIDVLIHHLGVDLEKRIDTVDSHGRSEEELIGADDEDIEEIEEKYIKLNTSEIVKICNRKVKQLISKMIRNFEVVDLENELCISLLMKLLAVLTLLRELRTLDVLKTGIPFGGSFVPLDERKKLLKISLRFLFGQKNNFYEKAKEELIEENLDELSRLKGLMLWLTHDCGADLFSEKEFGESPEQINDRKFNKSYLLLIVPITVVDLIAFEEAKISILKTSRKVSHYDKNVWLKQHQNLGEKLFQVRKRAHQIHHKIKRTPRTGDFAFLRGEVFPTLQLALRGGDDVILSYIDNEDGKKQYPAQKIAGISIN